jgi:aspartyl-tRNA(Asn)/glutamyl-tRNA(Gln) amidotransferase subunit A
VLSTICELGRKLRDRSISPVELTHDCLDRIEKLNPKLNAYITVTAESALERARLAEREIYRGTYLGPLHGIPIGLKDIIDTAGVRTTAASGVFKDRVPPSSSGACVRAEPSFSVSRTCTNLLMAAVA